MARLSLETRAEIIERRKSGQRYAQIARELQLSPETVRRICNNYQSRGTLEPLRASGRPRAINDRNRVILKRAVRQDPKKTIKQIQQELPIRLSTLTVSKVLNEMGLREKKRKSNP